MKRIFVACLVLLVVSSVAFANPHEENESAKSRAVKLGSIFAAHRGTQPTDIEGLFEAYPSVMKVVRADNFAPYYSMLYRPPGLNGWGVGICATKGTACYLVTQENPEPKKMNIDTLQKVLRIMPEMVAEVYKNVMVVHTF